MIPLPDELERLAQSLALAEGFQLVLAECRGLDAADMLAQLDAACDRVAALRGAPPLLLRYDPRSTTDAGGGLRDEAWVEGVLGSILALPRPTAPGATLVAVLDGATLDDDDLTSWTYLLHRLNERRNAIARALDGTLLLALAPPLVRLFLHEAPDAASIRSGHFVLDASTRAATPSLPLDLTSWYPPALLAEAARLRASARPDPSHAMATLHDLLIRSLSESKLRRFAYQFGPNFGNRLPGSSASISELAHAFVLLAENHGLLGEVLGELRRVRSRLAPEIDRIAADLGVTGSTSTPALMGTPSVRLLEDLVELSQDQLEAVLHLIDAPLSTRPNARQIVRFAERQGTVGLLQLADAIARVRVRRS